MKKPQDDWIAGSNGGASRDGSIAQDGHNSILDGIALFCAICLCDAVLVGDLAIVSQ